MANKLIYVHLRLSIACAASFFVGIASAQTTPHLLTQSEFDTAQRQLQPKQIPGLSGALQPDARQSFVIPGKASHVVRMIPVKYDSLTPATGNTNYRCGIFFAADTAAPVFVPTIGYDFTEVLECGSLTAVGFMPVLGEEFPRLLLVYNAGSINGYGAAPVVLDFSAAKRTYVPNEALSERTYNRGGAITIARMKQNLQSAPK